MVKVENDCCGCAVPGYPCLGESCELRHIEHYYCDMCGEETDILYDFDDELLCRECAYEAFDTILKAHEVRR